MGGGASKRKLTTLPSAAKNGDMTEIKKKLMMDKTIIDQLDDFDCTALYWACHKGNLDCVNFLLEHDAHLELANKDGDTPLLAAAMAGKTDVLQYVASFGADVNHRDNHGYSALYWASKQGNLDVVKCLLQQKATDINLTDTDGWSPLRMASKEGHIDIVKYLIQNGANVHLRSNLGFLPIDCAANEETKNILRNAEIINAMNKFFVDTDVVMSEQPNGNKKTPQSRRALRNSLDGKLKIDTRDKSPASSRGTTPRATPRATPRTTPRTTPKSPSHLEWSKMQSGMTPKNLGKITDVRSANGGGKKERTVSPLDSDDIRASRAVAAAAAARLGLAGGGNSEKSSSIPTSTDQQQHQAVFEKKKKNRRATYGL